MGFPRKPKMHGRYLFSVAGRGFRGEDMIAVTSVAGLLGYVSVGIAGYRRSSGDINAS